VANVPHITGTWVTLPYPMPINPISATLMRTGQVLIVAGSENDADNYSTTAQSFRNAVWDPTGTTLSSISVQNVDYDVFCSGVSVLPDGRPLIVGGTASYSFTGDNRAAFFDPVTGTFNQAPAMADGRWYATTTVLGDGRLMALSGLNRTTGAVNKSVEIYDPANPGQGWLVAAPSSAFPQNLMLYPRMALLPSGRVFYTGHGSGNSTPNGWMFDPAAQTWTTSAPTLVNRVYGSTVLLPLSPPNYVPKVMNLGGGSPTLSTTEIIDLSLASPTYTPGPSMSTPRIQMNAVLLPDGTVLALGGSASNEVPNAQGKNADIYLGSSIVDAPANTFVSGGTASYSRLYHSTALLLPDARVMVVGSNPGSRGDYEPAIEIYTPAYLFDASDRLVTTARPSISSVAPASGVLGYGAPFSVNYTSASAISAAVLVRPGSSTHTVDMDQRVVVLCSPNAPGNACPGTAGTLNLQTPPNGNIAPPGYYMLFLLDSAGVPSVARFVKLSTTTGAPPDGVITAPAADVTIPAGGSVSFSTTTSAAKYGWVFPGGSPALSTAQNPGAVTFSTPGTYVASLTVLDANGNSDPSPPTRTIRVTPSTGDFSITVSPAARVVLPGQSATFNVTVTPISGFTGSVSLTVTSEGGFPIGVSSGGFSPATITGGGGTSTLTMNTTGAALPFALSLSIKGTGTTRNHIASTTLVVAINPPASITATPAQNQVALSWPASIGATGYRVKRSAVSGGPYVTVACPTATSYVDTGVADNTTYHYVVSATFSGGPDAGGESADSGEVSATTPIDEDTQPPTAPSNLTAAAAGATHINLNWTASTDSVGVTGYQVERCQGAACTNFSQIATPPAASFTDTGLAASTTYRYRVRATDAALNLSGYSNVVSATTSAASTDLQPPTTPSNLAATAASSTQINVSWTASTDNVAVTAYRLEQCQGTACANFVQIGTPTTTTFTNTGLTAGATYRYRVLAADAAGNVSGYSTVASTTTPIGNPGLVAAYGFEESAGSQVADASGHGNTGNITNATWTTGRFGSALLFNGNGMVTINDAPELRLTTAMTLSAWVNPSQVASAWRDIIYKGNDVYFLEGMSEPNAVPAAGGKFGTTGESVAVTYGTSPLPVGVWTHLALTWDGATLRLYVNATQVASQPQTGALDVSTNPLEIGGDSTFNQHFHGSIDEVRVYNVALTQPQIQADMSTAVGGGGTSDTQPPTDPSGLTATAAGSTQINLSWTTSTDNVAVTGYRIERCQGASCTNFAEVATPTGASHSDTGLAASTTYRYRVRANDAAGNFSGYSNVASATTAAAQDTQPPTDPSGLTATAAGTTQINLSWTASTDNVGVTGYRVERCLGASCTNFAQIATPTGASHSDTGLAASTTYRYRVRATDAAGNFSGYSNVASATTAATQDTQPPTDPSGLTATAAGTTQINLSWTASTDNVAVTGYRVERCQGASCTNFAQIATPPGASHSDTGLAASTTYRYRVRATDAAGNLSGYSNEASATTPAGTSGLVAAYGFEEGTDTTTADSSGNGNAGTITNATWTTAGRFGSALVFNGNAMVTITDAPELRLTTAMTLSAWVNPSQVTSGWRDVIYKGLDVYFLEATSEPGGAPVSGGKFGTTMDSVVALWGPAALQVHTWSYLATTWDGATLRLYVNGTQVASAAVSGSLDVSTAPLQIGGDSSYGQFFLGMIDEVRVYNVALTPEQIQADMNTAVGGGGTQDTQAPTSPSGLTATATGATQINLNWTASTDNVAVTGYLVERCQGTACTNFVQIATPTAANFTDTGLAGSTSYRYRVRATDAAGNLSGYSSIATGTTSDTQAPTAPTSLSATAVSQSQINLNWTASTDNVAVTGYRVERCQGAGCINFAEIGTPTGTTFANTGLTEGTSYSYRVRATDAAGNLGGYSNVATTTPAADTQAPTAPSGLAATAASQSQINLSWTASTDNVGVTGYRVERCQGAACTNFAEIGTATATTFANTGLTPVTSYRYRVRAVDAAGNLSGYSNVATATTPDTQAPTAPSNLTATAVSSSQINLTWTASTDNVGVTGYRVERCQGASCTNFTQVGTPTATSFSSTGLTANRVYRFRVRAVDAAGNLSPFSNIASARTNR
jgi:chitodextrinase